MRMYCLCKGNVIEWEEVRMGQQKGNEHAKSFFPSVMSLNRPSAALPSLTACLGASQYTWRYFDCLILNIFDVVVNSRNYWIVFDCLSMDFGRFVWLKRSCKRWKFLERSLDLNHSIDLNLLLAVVVCCTSFDYQNGCRIQYKWLYDGKSIRRNRGQTTKSSLFWQLKLDFGEAVIVTAVTMDDGATGKVFNGGFTCYFLDSPSRKESSLSIGTIVERRARARFALS